MPDFPLTTWKHHKGALAGFVTCFLFFFPFCSSRGAEGARGKEYEEDSTNNIRYLPICFLRCVFSPPDRSQAGSSSKSYNKLTEISKRHVRKEQVDTTHNILGRQWGKEKYYLVRELIFVGWFKLGYTTSAPAESLMKCVGLAASLGKLSCMVTLVPYRPCAL